MRAIPLVAGVFIALAIPAQASQDAACTNADVRAVAGQAGGGGSVFVLMRMTNTTGVSCVVRGHPRIDLFAGDGRVIAISRHWSDADKRVGRVVIEGSGATRAFARVRWGNYCGKRGGTPRMRMSLPAEHGTIPVEFTLPDPLVFPRCDAPTKRPGVSVKRFTRHASAV